MFVFTLYLKQSSRICIPSSIVDVLPIGCFSVCGWGVILL